MEKPFQWNGRTYLVWYNLGGRSELLIYDLQAQRLQVRASCPTLTLTTIMTFTYKNDVYLIGIQVYEPVARHLQNQPSAGWQLTH